jgi:hypothetical protein
MSSIQGLPELIALLTMESIHRDNLKNIKYNNINVKINSVVRIIHEEDMTNGVVEINFDALSSSETV